jgi:hypothetical protein
MAFNVSDFRSQLAYDGARPNLFQVTLVLPAYVNNSSAAGQKITFMAKAAQLPGSTVGVVPVYYFGRETKFAGNRTFADWTLQIINDEDFLIRGAMESWLDAINSHSQNTRSANASGPSNYSVDATVTQYGKTGSAIYNYNFVGMFPVDMAPIDLDWGSNDAMEEFSVTFSYQYWNSVSTT